MLNNLLSIHKKTVLFGENSGNSVAVILKPQPSDDGFDLRGYTNFVGLDFTDGDKGYFGDSFELTINADDLFEKTDKKPVEGWIANVELPQMNNEKVDFYVKNVAYISTRRNDKLAEGVQTFAGEVLRALRVELRRG